MPSEVAELVRGRPPQRILELGCGVGRFSQRLARAGHDVVGVDFSPVAIEKARARVARDPRRPEFIVADVGDLSALDAPFDLSFDVGCYHCLQQDQQGRYATQLERLLAPNGTHLIWVMDDSPSGLPLSASDVMAVFGHRFVLRREAAVRRRLVNSHWYWLERA